MGRKPRVSRDATVKYEEPLPRRLRELVTNTRDLAERLGCSPQAVNQYKTGEAQPSISKLLEISEFYGVSVDYLLGITNVKSRDTSIQTVCEYTGLPEEAIKNLQRIMFQGRFDNNYTKRNLGELPLYIISYILSKPFLFEFLSQLASKYQRIALQKHLDAEELSFLSSDSVQCEHDKSEFLQDCGAIYDEIANDCLSKFARCFQDSFDTFLQFYEDETTEQLDKIKILREKLNKEADNG